MKGTYKMNIIVCLDDNLGMLFNKRRQSKDKRVLEDIATFTNELSISPFSEDLFSESICKTKVDKFFLEQAPPNTYCFVEADGISPYIDRIEQLIIYKWNRKYPTDFKFDISLENWKKIEQKEFAGFSHEKITKEVYVKGSLR